MGDSNLQVMIYDCTSAEAGAVLEVLERHGLHYDLHGRHVSTAHRAVHLAYLYGDADVYAGASTDLAADLTAAAPGVTFQTWTDPDREGLGQLVVRVPELGDFTAECDKEGDPVFRSADLLPAVEQGYAATRERLGVPWFAALARLTPTDPTQPLRVVAPAPEPDELGDMDEADREDLAHDLNRVRCLHPAAP